MFSYPRSRNDFNCELVNRLGSPIPSIATASNSSNGGAINKSRKLIGRHLLRFACNCVDDGCVNASLIFVLPDNGGGSTAPQNKTKI